VVNSGYRHSGRIAYNPAMGPTYEEIAALDRDDIEDAKRTTGSQKLRDAGDLFDDACRCTMSGIRSRFPGISDDDALTELRRIIALGQKLEWNTVEWL
jgi:hypothetical protein